MRLFFINICFLILLSTNAGAEILKKVEINGNERISNETIKVYGEIEINKKSIDSHFSLILRLFASPVVPNIARPS